MDPFDRMYEGSPPPPWEIDRPQAEVVALADRGLIQGRVLDLGCGTGENALHLAALGAKVVGVDGARAAIAAAQRKSTGRGVHAEFLVHDALSVSALGASFDAVLDSGFFHTLDDDARRIYREEMAGVMVPGAALFILCFSEREPDWGGPRRVTEADLRRVFDRPFFVESIEPARYELNGERGGAEAWLATITYVGTSTALVS